MKQTKQIEFVSEIHRNTCASRAACWHVDWICLGAGCQYGARPEDTNNPIPRMAALITPTFFDLTEREKKKKKQQTVFEKKEKSVKQL